MRVGILGSGLMGGKLGTLFARAGHEVVFSYARSEQGDQRPSSHARFFRHALALTGGLRTVMESNSAGRYAASMQPWHFYRNKRVFDK